MREQDEMLVLRWGRWGRRPSVPMNGRRRFYCQPCIIHQPSIKRRKRSHLQVRIRRRRDYPRRQGCERIECTSQAYTEGVIVPSTYIGFLCFLDIFYGRTWQQWGWWWLAHRSRRGIGVARRECVQCVAIGHSLFLGCILGA